MNFKNNMILDLNGAHRKLQRLKRDTNFFINTKFAISNRSAYD